MKPCRFWTELKSHADWTSWWNLTEETAEASPAQIGIWNILKQILKIIFANSRDEFHPKPTQLQAAFVDKLVMPGILYLPTN